MKYCDHTVSNITCQRWDATTPHKPKFLPPENDRHHNFCRNPDDDLQGPWCYTVDETRRWEYCDLDNCTYQEGTVTASTPKIKEQTSGLELTAPLCILVSFYDEGSPSTANDTTILLGRTSETPNIWYPYVIAAAIVILFIVSVTLFVIKRKKQKSRNPNENQSAPIAYYGDFQEEGIQRARENTYTEIPYFTKSSTDYERPACSGTRTLDESGAESSNTYSNVFGNFSEGQIDEYIASNTFPSTYEPATDPVTSIAEGSTVNTTYEIPTELEQVPRTISTDPEDQNIEEANKNSTQENYDYDVYRGPVEMPELTDQTNAEYKTISQKAARLSNRPPLIKNISSLDSAIEDDAPSPMICISPKLIDNVFDYNAESQENAYALPTSPVFPLDVRSKSEKDLQTDSGYISREASLERPNEYCAMDDIPGTSKKNPEKTVTLSRTYTTMHRVNAPLSRKEMRRQYKTQGGKRRNARRLDE